MADFCHRCGGEVPAGEAGSFCPHCGAPQLYLRNYDAPAADHEGASPGSVAPPRPGEVDWRMAIRCAAIVGGVAGILALGGTRFAVLSGLSSMWFVAGSLIALTLYQKRRPGAWMDAKVGARIGVLVGLALALGLMGSMAVAGVVGRYALHTMGNFDAAMVQQSQMMVDRTAQAGSATPEMIQFFRSQEFHAGTMLAVLMMMIGLLLVFSTVGGALAGMMRTRKASV